MKTTLNDYRVSEEQLAAWNSDGFLIVKGLFSPAEVAEVKEHFDAFGTAGQALPGCWEPDLGPVGQHDPLKRYPRVMMPHRWPAHAVAKRYLLHPPVHDVLAALYQAEPIAVQSMYYYKPPGARGQALHQDNFYLQVKPNTCIAAWTAIDPAGPDNGGLYVVPGTHDMEIVCPEEADPTESFVTHLVKAPKGKKAIPVVLEPGDTLFFNGSLVHGSGPNRSKTQWRRAFICHYMPATATHISPGYFPALNFTGEEVHFEASRGGGPCGTEFVAPVYGA